MRMIDADSLRGVIQAIEWENTDIAEGLILADCAVLEQPTVDAVPVIRCKDCVHNVANKTIDPLCTNDYSGCDIVCDYFETDGMEPDDYCSYAERKEE